MTTTTLRRSGIARAATGGLVAALALAGCGTQRAGNGAEGPPVLRIGAVASGSFGVGTLDSAGVAAANDAKTRGNGAYTVRGTLPDGPSSAPVYRYGSGQADEARVAALAAAFGLDATPSRHAHGWEVTGAAGVLHVSDRSGHEWTFSRTTEECATYLVDIDSADPYTSMSSCTRAVAVDGGPVAGSSSAAGTAGTSATTPPPPSGASPSPPSPAGQSDPSAGTGGGDDPLPIGPPDAVPTPAVPAPSAADALAAARPVLAALGIDATPRALDAWSEWRTVLVDPTVAGLPTLGIATTIDVDKDGIVGATGRLDAPSAGPDYPVVSATAALDRLATQPQPMPAVDCVTTSDASGSPAPAIGCAEPGTAVDCPVAKDGTTSCPSVDVVPSVVTGASFGLMLSFDGTEAVLVPAWLFAIEGWSDPMPVVAVDDKYLGNPEPITGTGSGSGGGSAPGSPGTDTPVAPPSDPGTVVEPTPLQPGSVAVTAASLSADGRTLTLTGWGGVCAEYRGDAKETGTEVYVVISSTPTIDKDMACIELAKEISVDVTLQAPLGTRVVVDGNTSERVAVA
jgi:hypothetical protein